MYGGIFDELNIMSEVCSILDYIHESGKTYVVLTPNDQEVVIVEEMFIKEKNEVHYYPLKAEKQKEIYDIFYETNVEERWRFNEFVSVVDEMVIREEAEQAGLRVQEFVRWYGINYLITENGILCCLEGKGFQVIKNPYVIECILKSSEYKKNCGVTWAELESWIAKKRELNSNLNSSIINVPYGSGYICCEVKERFVHEGKEYVSLEPVESKAYQNIVLQVVKGMYSGSEYYIYEN